MKKAILPLIAACAITTAFAQNSATLSQSGTGNASYTNQVGDAQTAVVSQTGNGNYNYNEQFSYYSQLTNVEQIGNGNAAYTYQNDDAGPANLINVYQNGDNNLAVATQSSFYTWYSAAYIQQVGVGNEGYVQQLGTTNDVAVIDQYGYYGRGYIYQGDGSGFYSSSNSLAYIQQYSNFGPQYAVIYQLGDNNTAYTLQNADAGPDNYAYVVQNGNNNFALVDQSDFYTWYTTGYISQTGNGNVAALYQRDAGNGQFTTNSVAYIIQNGDGNYATFQQSGGANNYAYMTQTGDGNLIQGVSTSYGVQLGDNNSLVISQTNNYGAGYGQVANVQQLGSGNVGSITQSN
jgi:hypothetical protein